MLHPRTPAPDFTLPDADGQAVSLRDFRGRMVVLAFYPKDRSAVCSLQLRSYAKAHDGLTAAGGTLLGISPDSPASHAGFRDSCGFPFRLLSDADQRVAAAYDLPRILGMYPRAVVIVSPDGLVLWSGSRGPLLYPSMQDILERAGVGS